MRALELEQWSLGDSVLHRREARVKVILMLAMLVAIATLPGLTFATVSALAALVFAGILLGRLPVAAVLLRGTIVLPFTLAFATMAWISGDTGRAVALPVKSYLSALTVVLVAGTTPMPQLLEGARRLGTPRALILVLQFLYRYLFVIASQAATMRWSALSRGLALPGAGRRYRLHAATGMLAVLFGRSYQCAEGIQRSMLARGFSGVIHPLTERRLGMGDIGFGVAAMAAILAARLQGGLLP